MNKNIFISSTCFDLIDLRAEVYQLLSSSGLTPIMSDQLGSAFETFTEKNSIETCLVNLASCDTIVIILSQRYGPSLFKAGFGDFSATHLEYNEAKRLGKKIIFLVRDVLMADFNTYNKDNGKNINLLSWIKVEKDLKIFEIIEDRKNLIPGPNDNWYWPFKNSLDVKERLLIELKPIIRSLKFNEAVDTGKVPHVTVALTIDNIELGHLDNDSIEMPMFNFSLRNVGSEAAIQPLFVIYRAENYQEVLEQKMSSSAVNYVLQEIDSLLPGEKAIVSLPVKLVDRNGDTYRFVVEVWYKTINGYLLVDASEVSVNVLLFPKIKIKSNYTVKRQVHENAFKRIIDSVS